MSDKYNLSRVWWRREGEGHRERGARRTARTCEKNKTSLHAGPARQTWRMPPTRRGLRPSLLASRRLLRCLTTTSDGGVSCRWRVALRQMNPRGSSHRICWNAGRRRTRRRARPRSSRNHLPSLQIRGWISASSSAMLFRRTRPYSKCHLHRLHTRCHLAQESDDVSCRPLAAAWYPFLQHQLPIPLTLASSRGDSTQWLRRHSLLRRQSHRRLLWPHGKAIVACSAEI